MNSKQPSGDSLHFCNHIPIHALTRDTQTANNEKKNLPHTNGGAHNYSDREKTRDVGIKNVCLCFYHSTGLGLHTVKGSHNIYM